MGEIILTPFDIIFKAIRREMQITKSEIISRDRGRNVSEARQMFCHLARMHTEETTTTIGDAIKRNHSTVVYSNINMRGLCKGSKRLNIARNYIEKDLKENLHKIVKIEICKHCKQPIHEERIP
tara:strand:- start:457 stop:828 length:372 start_codon:yes stop_codon:yes gene_type:complete